MIHVVLRFIRKIFAPLREKKVLLYAGIYILILWIIATILFHEIEGISILDSFYWAVTTTTTVGYGDITPKTTAGKLISIFVMLSGIGVLGIFLASIAEILIEKSLKRRPRVYMENHVLALGWDKKIETAVKELLKEGVEVVVIAEVEGIPIEHSNLSFLRGDPTDDENLIRAKVDKASFAIISGRDDTETLLTAIAVKKLNERIQVTCIVSDPRVKKALEKIEVDQVLSIDEFSGLVLCRSVFSPRISMLFNELMASEGMDIYEERIPEFVGKRVEDVIIEMKRKYNAVMLGIVRNGKVVVNPPKDEVLSGDEEIIYIAEKKIRSR